MYAKLVKQCIYLKINQFKDRKDAETQAKSESQATLITNLTQTIEQ